MDIVHASQLFVPDANGNFTFSHTQVIYRSEGCLYSAKSRHRKYTDGVLEDVCLIPVEAYQPIAPPDVIVASDRHGTYMKTPNLSGFDGGDNLACQVLQEIRTCEAIYSSPHINLATYYGCSLVGDRIAGLCFKWYPASLLTIVNPGHLNKSMLIEAEERQSAREQAAHFLDGIEDGIRHLHELKISHNDITPANILITKDNTPVISDFDSSSCLGADISRVKRTHGWYDPTVHLAQEINDFDALFELRIWLTGLSPTEYRFKE
jgi:serine/threonine protein kinase